MTNRLIALLRSHCETVSALTVGSIAFKSQATTCLLTMSYNLFTNSGYLAGCWQRHCT